MLINHFSVSSMIAAALAASISSPLDVIKTRIQVRTCNEVKTKPQVQGGGLPISYRGAWDAIVQMKQQEGWSAFRKGMLARVLWITPSTTIVIATCKYCCIACLLVDDQFKKILCT